MIGLLAPAYAARWVLRQLPGPLRAPLDAWSRRVAQRRAVKRRQVRADRAAR